MKKLMKKQKGITLIALVVTIIVLLILAGISIMMLTGQSGILNQAKSAKEDTRGGEVKEAVALAVSENTMAEYTGQGTKKTKSELVQELYKAGKLTDEEVAKLEEGNQITIGSIDIDFRKLTDVKTLVQAFKDGEINVGDYVNYQNPSSGRAEVGKEETGYDAIQIYEVDSSTTWRVLGLSEDGNHVLLTSGSPIKRSSQISTGGNPVLNKNSNIPIMPIVSSEPTPTPVESAPYLVLAGAEGYCNCEATLDKICGIYKNSFADSSKSMRFEDIERALGVEGIDILEGSSYTYKNGDYAPENYMIETYGDKYTRLGKKKAGDKVYNSNYTLSPDSEEGLMDANSTEKENVIKMLFDGTSIDENISKSYWLASTGENAYDFVFFGPGAVIAGGALTDTGLFNCDGSYVAGSLAVRPVVSLKSDITVDEIHKTTGSEQDWSTIPYMLLTAVQSGQVDKGKIGGNFEEK